MTIKVTIEAIDLLKQAGTDSAQVTLERVARQKFIDAGAPVNQSYPWLVFTHGHAWWAREGMGDVFHYYWEESEDAHA